jgi:hypothetical protein
MDRGRKAANTGLASLSGGQPRRRAHSLRRHQKLLSDTANFDVLHVVLHHCNVRHVMNHGAA